MWIIDADGDAFNTDHYCSIRLTTSCIQLWLGEKEEGVLGYDIFSLPTGLEEKDRRAYYHYLLKLIRAESII